MADAINIKVVCHACGYKIEGTAKYGKGHYIPTGVPFDFVATGKKETPKGRQVQAEVTCVCPKCTVKNRYAV